MDKIGVGSYGCVFEAKNQLTGELVAIKAQDCSSQEDVPVSILREIRILRLLDHPNIVKCLEVIPTLDDNILLVLELSSFSLADMLRTQRMFVLSLSEVKHLTIQLLDATQYMHQKGVLHRDLAPKNILMNNSGHVKVCDFGISRLAFADDEEYGFVSAEFLEAPHQIVTLRYRAIELLLGNTRYGPAIDVWSLGCILGELLLYQVDVRQELFPGISETDMVQKIDRVLGRQNGAECIYLEEFFSLREGRDVHSKYRMTDTFYDLSASLLRLCPEERGQAKSLVSHAWFSEQPLPGWKQ